VQQYINISTTTVNLLGPMHYTFTDDTPNLSRDCNHKSITLTQIQQ